MYKIGLTGGIGTGKSFVAKLFTQKGIPVYDADSHAKNLYSDNEVLHEIEKALGYDVIDQGQVNLKKISDLIFYDLHARELVEAIIHPRLINDFSIWCSLQNNDIVLMEAAILFEAHFEHLFDFIVTVDAPDDLRITRLKERNPSWLLQDIKQRMCSQMSQAEKCHRADFVIYNDNTQSLLPQIDVFLAQIEK